MDITLVVVASLLAALLVLLVPKRASAHCDTLDGPATATAGQRWPPATPITP